MHSSVGFGRTRFPLCILRFACIFFLTAITVGVLLINNTRRDKVLSHGRGSLFGGVLWVLLGVLRGGGAVLRWSAAHCAAAALTARFVVLWGACCVVGWSAGQHDSSVHSDSVILRKEGGAGLLLLLLGQRIRVPGSHSRPQPPHTRRLAPPPPGARRRLASGRRAGSQRPVFGALLVPFR